MLYILILLLKGVAMFFESCNRSLSCLGGLIWVFIEFPGRESLTELMSTIVQRVGDEIDRTHLPRLMVCWNLTPFLIFIPTHTRSIINLRIDSSYIAIIIWIHCYTTITS